MFFNSLFTTKDKNKSAIIVESSQSKLNSTQIRDQKIEEGIDTWQFTIHA